MELKGLKINFLGDSITWGVGASSEDSVYHAVLKKEAGLLEARNYGRNGTRFAVQKGSEVMTKNDSTDMDPFCERFYSDLYLHPNYNSFKYYVDNLYEKTKNIINRHICY